MRAHDRTCVCVGVREREGRGVGGRAGEGGGRSMLYTTITHWCQSQINNTVHNVKYLTFLFLFIYAST